MYTLVQYTTFTPNKTLFSVSFIFGFILIISNYICNVLHLFAIRQVLCLYIVLISLLSNHVYSVLHRTCTTFILNKTGVMSNCLDVIAI